MSNQVFANTSGNGIRYSPNVQIKDVLTAPIDPLVPRQDSFPAVPTSPVNSQPIKYAAKFTLCNLVPPVTTTVAGVARDVFTNGQNALTKQFYTIVNSSGFQNSGTQVTSLVDNILAVNWTLPFGFTNAKNLLEMWVAVYPPGYSNTQTGSPYVPIAIYGTVAGSFEGNNNFKIPMSCSAIVPLPAGCTMCFEYYGNGGATVGNINIADYLPWQLSCQIEKIN